jgi:transposase-like protein
LARALKRHGRPEWVVIDGSQTNREAILSCDATSRLEDRSRGKLKPICIRQNRSLNNRIEQDHRAILGGIEMIHMMRKQQTKYACNPQPSLAEQFDLLAA